MSFVRPTFQPQNPAINGYPLGWASCTCYAGAMAASSDRQVKKITTGENVRIRTGDTSGGTTLAQVDTALRSLTGVDLDVRYRMSWSDFAANINRGRAGILQLWYAPIADSRFDAGNGFRGNHAIFVPPDWKAMDPLADGRFSGVYKYHAEAYPQSLLRNAAGKLNLSATGYNPLGVGLVYAGLTKDRVSTYTLKFTGGDFWHYLLGPDGKIDHRRKETSLSGPTSAPCSMPIFYAWPGESGRMLVRILKGVFRGYYIDPNQSTVDLVERP